MVPGRDEVSLTPRNAPRDSREIRERALGPLGTALILTTGYVVLAASYIVLSGRAAARAATSVEQLQRIEALKGLVFIGATGFLFFLLTWLLMSRIEAQRTRLADQLEAMQRADRKALAGTFAGSIAHDLNNLLTTANARLYSRMKESRDPDIVEVSVTNVRWILDEMAALSRQLLEVGKGDARGARTRVRLDRLVADHLRLASGHPAVRGCRVTSLVDDGLEAEVDRNRFGALLLNLVLNAAEATSGTGRVHFGLKARGDEVVLEVHDDGPGVPESERDRIFEAFRTTKPQGTGLGLLTVRSVAEDHGGRVEVERSDELGGACFRVTIPRKGAA